LVQITSDIELSGAGCTTAITPNQLVQSSSENDIVALRGAGHTIQKTAELAGCSTSQVKRIWAMHQGKP
jgi:hypothetical protein